MDAINWLNTDSATGPAGNDKKNVIDTNLTITVKICFTGGTG
tara:strand:+ start:678 stop:803 length:126 start_codon:yes stop_codon:yes gene_type:complete